MEKETIECPECYSDYTLEYEGKQEPQYCPFCGEHIDLGEELYDE